MRINIKHKAARTRRPRGTLWQRCRRGTRGARKPGLDGRPHPPCRKPPADAVPEYIGEAALTGCSIGRCTCGCAVYSHHTYCYNCGALLRWDACTPA
mgnify:CR=1 FL=1